MFSCVVSVVGSGCTNLACVPCMIVLVFIDLFDLIHEVFSLVFVCR
jgi:hypothetical protein